MTYGLISITLKKKNVRNVRNIKLKVEIECPICGYIWGDDYEPFRFHIWTCPQCNYVIYEIENEEDEIQERFFREGDEED
jgi:rubrerythrin